jgi:transcriptional regulator with XRE-family HTH domain
MAGSRERGESVFPGFADLAADHHELLRRLVTRRVSLGLTQTDVAARMATTQSAVARLEAGGLNPRVETLERYAWAVGAELQFGITPQARPQARPDMRPHDAQEGGRT